jgi:hypothetical protein
MLTTKTNFILLFYTHLVLSVWFFTLCCRNTIFWRDNHAAQLTITLFLIGYAVGQLIMVLSQWLWT